MTTWVKHHLDHGAKQKNFFLSFPADLCKYLLNEIHLAYCFIYAMNIWKILTHKSLRGTSCVVGWLLVPAQATGHGMAVSSKVTVGLWTRVLNLYLWIDFTKFIKFYYFYEKNQILFILSFVWLCDWLMEVWRVRCQMVPGHKRPQNGGW